MESADLMTRARRAYEAGRLRWAARIATWVLPLALLSVVAAGNRCLSLATGAALLTACVALLWRGQAWGAAVRPGLLAGVIPLGLMLTLKCSSGYFCALGGCMAHCSRFCGVGGLAAGLLLAARARRQPEGAVQFLVAGGAVAALTGLLGCFVGGITGALWMALGELAALIPLVAYEVRSR